MALFGQFSLFPFLAIYGNLIYFVVSSGIIPKNVDVIISIQYIIMSFLVFSSQIWAIPAIFGNFHQLQMFCSKFWNPIKKLKTISQSNTKLWPFLAISSCFQQFPAVIGNYRQSLMFGCSGIQQKN